MVQHLKIINEVLHINTSKKKKHKVISIDAKEVFDKIPNSLIIKIKSKAKQKFSQCTKENFLLLVKSILKIPQLISELRVIGLMNFL